MESSDFDCQSNCLVRKRCGCQHQMLKSLQFPYFFHFQNWFKNWLVAEFKKMLKYRNQGCWQHVPTCFNYQFNKSDMNLGRLYRPQPTTETHRWCFLIGKSWPFVAELFKWVNYCFICPDESHPAPQILRLTQEQHGYGWFSRWSHRFSERQQFQGMARMERHRTGPREGREYPLVNVYITLENYHISWDNSL